MPSPPSLLPAITAALGVVTSRAAPAPAPSAQELAARLTAARLGNALVRVRMEVRSPETGKRVFQLQIKERRTKAATDLVYQVLWPRERKGEAVILRQSGNAAPTGSIVSPSGSVSELSGAALDEGLLESDLSYRDAIENFFAWESQELVGSAEVDGVSCVILESKPGQAATTYGSVRTWVDPRRFVPMRVEKYSGTGQLLRRIDTTRVAHDDVRRPIPANLTVRSPRKGGVTDLDGSRIKQDVTFDDEDFTHKGATR